MEERLLGKQTALDQLTVEGERLQEKLAVQAGTEQLHELETAVQNRNDIISQLTTNLQQAIENRDEVQREALQLTNQIQALQLQLQQASELLRTKSPGSMELAQAQQQMQVFQMSLKDQSLHLETLEQKAQELEQQLEDSRENAKDKENLLIHMTDKLENTEVQLNKIIDEKEELTLTISQLHHTLSVRDKEVLELKNEMLALTANQQQHSVQFQHPGTELCHNEELSRKLEEQMEEFQRERSEMEDRLNHLQEDLNRAEYQAREAMQYKTEKEKLNEDISKLNAIIEELNGKLTDEEEASKHWRAKYQVDISNYNMQLQTLEQEKAEVLSKHDEEIHLLRQQLESQHDDRVVCYKQGIENLKENLNKIKSRKDQVNHESTDESQGEEFTLELSDHAEEGNILMDKYLASSVHQESSWAEGSLEDHSSNEHSDHYRFELDSEILEQKMSGSTKDDLERSADLTGESFPDGDADELGLEPEEALQWQKYTIAMHKLDESADAIDVEKAFVIQRCTELSEQLNEKKKELDVLQTEVIRSSKDMQEVQDKCKKVTEELFVVRSELEAEKLERANCEEMIKLKSQKEEDLRNKLRIFEKQNEKDSADRAVAEIKNTSDTGAMECLIKELTQEKEFLLTQLQEQEQLVKDVQKQKLAGDSVTSEVQTLFGRQLAALQAQRDQLQLQLEAQKAKNQTTSELLGQKTLLEDSLCKELHLLKTECCEREALLKNLAEEKADLESKLLCIKQNLLNADEALNQNSRDKTRLEQNVLELEIKVKNLENVLESERQDLGNQLKSKRLDLQKIEVEFKNAEVEYLQKESALKTEVAELKRSIADLVRTHSEAVESRRLKEAEKLDHAVRAAQEELCSCYEEEKSKLKEQHQSELKEEVSVLQKEMEEKDSELETLLQRRERENEEGGNLVTMLRSDLSRNTEEQKSLQEAHERVLKLLLEVAKSTIATEDVISQRIGICMDSSQMLGGENLSVLGAAGQPHRKNPEGQEKGDLHSPASEAATETSLWSALTDEGFELSQRLSESIFTGPELEAETEQMILGVCERLRSAVEKLLDLVTESTRQGDDSRYRNAVFFLNGRLPTVPGMNCPTIQYEARSSCCTVPSPVEREIADLRFICSLSQEKVASLHKQLGVDSNESRTSMLQFPQALMEEKNQEIDHLNEQIFRLQQELKNNTDNKEKVASLHKQLGVDSNESRTSMLQFPQALMEEKNQEIDHLNEQIFRLQQELKNNTDNKVLEEKNVEIEDLRSQIEHLHGDQERLRRDKDEEVEQLHEVIEKLQEELAQLGPNRHEVSDSQDSPESPLHSLERELWQHPSQEDSLQRELASEHLQSSKARLRELEGQLDLACTEKEYFRSEVEKLGKDLHNERRQHSILQEESVLLRASLSQREAEVGMLSTQARELEDILREREAQLLETETQVKTLEEQIVAKGAGLEAELSKKQEECEELQSLKSLLDSQLQDLKQAEVKNQGDIETLQAEVAKLEACMKDSQVEILTLSSEKTELFSECQALQLNVERLQGEVERLKVEVAEKNTLVQELSAQLEDKSARNAAAQKEVLSMLKKVYEEGCRVLALSQRADPVSLPVTSPLTSTLSDSWLKEKQALQETIQSLKELLSKMVVKGDVKAANGDSDWRRELLQAVRSVFNIERDWLCAELQSHLCSQGSGDMSILIERLESIVKEQDEQQRVALEQLLSADRSSLLSEIQSLQAQQRISHLQNQEQLQASLTTAEEQASKREHQLRRQVELLEYKLQQEQEIVNDLQNSLRAEQARSTEQRSHLKSEQDAVADLKQELSDTNQELERQQEQAIVNDLQNSLRAEQARSTKQRSHLKSEQDAVTDLKQELSDTNQELERSLKAQQELQKEIRKLRANLESQEADLCSAVESLEKEQQRVKEIQDILDQERLKNILRNDQEGQTHELLQTSLEDRNIQNSQLCSALEQERIANSNLRKELQIEQSRCEALLSQERSKLGEVQRLLEIEKGRTTELSDGLAREQQRLAQEYKQRLEEEALRREGVATQEHNFIQQLQAQLDQERERTVELAAMMEKTQQQAIQAKRQLEAGVQQSREEAQREHDTAAKLHTVLETLQTQKQELERSLETERQQGTRLRADIEQLQGKIQSVKQKERSREEQREVQRRQDRQALSEKDRRHERDSEKLHEMELQHQRDQLRIKQLQQTLSELEEQERDLSSRKQQQTGVLGTGHSCSFPQAPDRKSFFLHQQHLQFTRQQLQLATLRLKDLVHSSSARTVDGRSYTEDEDMKLLLKTLTGLDNDLLNLCSSTQRPVQTSSIISERLLKENADLTTCMGALTEEKIDLKRTIAKLEKELLIHKQRGAGSEQVRSHEMVDSVQASERAVWQKERAFLHSALKKAESELSRVTAEIENRPLAADVSHTKQINRLYGRYMRAESFRKALVYQKKYLLLLLGGFQDCEQATLSLIARMGVYPSAADLQNSAPRSLPINKFRSAVRVVIAISRLRFLVKKWQKATKKGPIQVVAVNGSTHSEGPGFRTEVLRQHPGVTFNSPPTRETEILHRSAIAHMHPPPKSPYRLHNR
ncbi:UNVERIFIED_CONTAM: hypothetical protein FKN15_078257 [Acipenser sinensis]